MSLHYLVDLYTTPLSSSRILDVHTPEAGASPVNGAILIRVPDGVSVVNPLDLGDLLTKKYQGLLALYAGFPNIAYDDLLDATGINYATVSLSGTFGERGTVQMETFATLDTLPVALAGPPVTQCVVTWENYAITQTDPASGRVSRVYTDVPATPGNMTCQVSVDGGATFTTTLDGGVATIPLASQGNSLVLRFINQAAGRLGLGSWAVIY